MTDLLRQAAALSTNAPDADPSALEHNWPSLEGIFPGYAPAKDEDPAHDGCGTKGLQRVLAQAAVVSPATKQPFTAPMLFGLGGGVSFMLFAFEYEGFGPTLTLGFRWPSVDAEFALGVLERLGADFEDKRTASAKIARQTLDVSLERKQAVMVSVDLVALGYRGFDKVMLGAMPSLLPVCGQVDDQVWVDDFAPRRLPRDAVAAARGTTKKAKHRLLRVGSPALNADLKSATEESISKTLDQAKQAPCKGFANNFGFAGLKKWRTLLGADTATSARKEKKAWSKVFSEGEYAFLAFSCTYECIEWDSTAGGASRHLYADFLDEAATLLNKKKGEKLVVAAARFRSAGDAWADLAEVAVADDQGLERVKGIARQRRVLLLSGRAEIEPEMVALSQERLALRRASALTSTAATQRRQAMLAQLDLVLAAETAAFEALSDA